MSDRGMAESDRGQKKVRMGEREEKLTVTEQERHKLGRGNLMIGLYKIFKD